MDLLLVAALLFVSVSVCQLIRHFRASTRTNNKDYYRYINLVHNLTGVRKDILITTKLGNSAFFQMVADLAEPQYDRHVTNIKELLNFVDAKDKTRIYTDICCDQIGLSKDVAEYLGIGPESVYVIGATNSVHDEDITTKLINMDHLPSDSTDLITCAQTLHRLDDEELRVTLQESYRITKECGLLIIYEHDANKKLLEYLYIIRNLVFGKAAITRESLREFRQSLSLYPRTRERLHKLVEDCGFRRVLTWDPFPSNLKNPTNSYYSVYVK